MSEKILQSDVRQNGFFDSILGVIVHQFNIPFKYHCLKLLILRSIPKRRFRTTISLFLIDLDYLLCIDVLIDLSDITDNKCI